MRQKAVVIVQGGQWGSEAKGAVAGYLCRNDQVNIAVRTGAVNAGHSVYYKGIKVVNQQLPVGWVNPDVTLVVGAGALIAPDILEREVAEISRLTGKDVRLRLKIDRRAALHLPAHINRSKASGRHHSMGATGKGCSEALTDRIRNRGRLDALPLFGESVYSKDYDVCDTEAYLNWSWDEGAKILLEGTQGQLLDLYLGPYPYVTHKQCGPGQWMLEAGLSPALPTEIVMVVRTFPIRVAGNSGPMPQEINWPILAEQINAIRVHHKLRPIVAPDAVHAFEMALHAVSTNFKIPSGHGAEYAQQTWTAEERATYQEALSEMNAAAWKSLEPACQTELLKLFELTTVTKKLRRVATLDRESLVTAARQIRPAWVALTFMNYVFPASWYSVPKELSPDEREYIKWIEESCRAPVRLVSYGPSDEHVLSL